MKILFDLGHPAHYHLFKNFIRYLLNNDIGVDLTIRNKDVIKVLIEHDNLNCFSLAIHKNSLIGLATEFLKRTFFILNLNRKNRYSIALGTSVSIGFLSLLTKCKSWNFNEDDDEIIKQYALLSYPFASKIFNPDCLRFEKFKSKRVLHNSYHELAYLHPNNFEPDKNLLKKYNLVDKKYVILRLNSLQAHHDIGAKGISNEMYFKIKALLKDYIIIESRENSKTHQIEPWDMHHVLAFTKMIICDSQTMAAEAMVLGVPSIRINTFVGRISYLEELENKYNLGYGILPLAENESNILDTINYLANDTNIESLWQEKKEKMLSEKCDLNQWMIEYFEKEINKTIVK